MSATLKLRPIGNSEGVCLPKDMLKRYGIAKGDVLYAIGTPNGILLTPYDPDFATVIDSNRDYMKRHRDALHELSKR